MYLGTLTLVSRCLCLYVTLPSVIQIWPLLAQMFPTTHILKPKFEASTKQGVHKPVGADIHLLHTVYDFDSSAVFNIFRNNCVFKILSNFFV